MFVVNVDLRLSIKYLGKSGVTSFNKHKGKVSISKHLFDTLVCIKTNSR